MSLKGQYNENLNLCVWIRGGVRYSAELSNVFKNTQGTLQQILHCYAYYYCTLETSVAEPKHFGWLQLRAFQVPEPAPSPANVLCSWLIKKH